MEHVTKNDLKTQLQLLNSLSEGTKYVLSYTSGGTRLISAIGSMTGHLEMRRGTKRAAYDQLRAMCFALLAA